MQGLRQLTDKAVEKRETREIERHKEREQERNREKREEERHTGEISRKKNIEIRERNL